MLAKHPAGTIVVIDWMEPPLQLGCAGNNFAEILDGLLRVSCIFYSVCKCPPQARLNTIIPLLVSVHDNQVACGLRRVVDWTDGAPLAKNARLSFFFVMYINNSGHVIFFVTASG